MHKVNLLFVITKLELGGAQTQLLALLCGLNKKDFNIFLFTSEGGLLTPEAEAVPGLSFKKSRWLKYPINPFLDVLALFELSSFIKKNNIQIVHTHSSKAGIIGRWAAKLAGARIILHTVHGWSFNDYQPPARRIFFIWLERLTAQLTDRIIVVSHHDRQVGLNRRIAEDSRYTLIRYGINYGVYNAKEENIRTELRIEANELVVGMVACLKSQKSPRDFVKLAYLINKTSQDVKFLLIGDGILRKKTEKLIRRLNLEKKVILTGWRRDIPRVLSAVDVFVLTSLWEGLPVSVLEAMASGKPVVATHTGGIKEVIIEGKTGFLVAPSDINGLCEKTTILLKDSSLRKNMGENARTSLGANFHFQNSINENQNLYRDLIKIKGPLDVN